MNKDIFNKKLKELGFVEVIDRRDGTSRSKWPGSAHCNGFKDCGAVHKHSWWPSQGAFFSRCQRCQIQYPKKKQRLPITQRTIIK